MREAQARFKQENPQQASKWAQRSSERMLARNPMSDPAIIQKMVVTKTKNGTLRTGFSGNRGGNGHLTSQQILLHENIGGSLEYAILTGPHRGFGVPHCYKADLALVDLKLDIEVDGGSHSSREQKTLDMKRDRVLAGLGWHVLRVSNADVTYNLAGVLIHILSTVRQLQTSLTLKSTSTRRILLNR
jgi:hypothetical protein